MMMRLSPHTETTHSFAGLHTVLVQSVPRLQPFPFAHFDVQTAPPQSTSVSTSFFTVSSHVAAWQTCASQTKLEQSAPVKHSTHAPAPLHVVPPVVHAVPVGSFVLIGIVPSHMSCVHSLPSFKTSVESTTIFMPPTPSHCSC